MTRVDFIIDVVVTLSQDHPIFQVAKFTSCVRVHNALLSSVAHTALIKSRKFVLFLLADIMQGRRVIREDSFKTAGDVNDVFLLFLLFSPSTNFHISVARMRRLSRRENLFATRVRLTAVEITSPRCIYIICLSAAGNGNIVRHPW